MDLNNIDSIVILTGAGISAESGIKTFRAEDGLWAKHRVEDVATPEGFMRDPELVVNFYNARRAQLSEVEPNAAHRALARLEEAHDGEVVLITQNVDRLHHEAGSARIIELHGALAEVRCLETIEHGQPTTPFMSFGDRVRMEAVGQNDEPLFGPIDQQAVRH